MATIRRALLAAAVGLSAAAHGQVLLTTTSITSEIVVFPRPASNLPSPPSMLVTGLPSLSNPQAVAYYGPDRALVTDLVHARLFVVQPSTATVVSTINTAGYYVGQGSLAVSPNGSYALASGNLSSIAVIEAPFQTGTAMHSIAIPDGGFVGSGNTQNIVFAQDGRAFVFHNKGISVLDPPC